MPNVKLFVDQAVLHRHDAAWDGVLVGLRDLLCDRLAVAASGCHLVIVPVRALADQPAVNLELHVMPHPDRTPDRMRNLCVALRDHVTAVTGTATAVRCAFLDPQTYIALK